MIICYFGSLMLCDLFYSSMLSDLLNCALLVYFFNNRLFGYNFNSLLSYVFYRILLINKLDALGLYGCINILVLGLICLVLLYGLNIRRYCSILCLSNIPCLFLIALCFKLSQSCLISISLSLLATQLAIFSRLFISKRRRGSI